MTEGVAYLVKVGVPNPFQSASFTRDDVVTISPLTKTISFHFNNLNIVVGVNEKI